MAEEREKKAEGRANAISAMREQFEELREMKAEELALKRNELKLREQELQLQREQFQALRPLCPRKERSKKVFFLFLHLPGDHYVTLYRSLF